MIPSPLLRILQCARAHQASTGPFRLPVTDLPVQEQILAREIERLLGALMSIETWAVEGLIRHP